MCFTQAWRWAWLLFRIPIPVCREKEAPKGDLSSMKRKDIDYVIVLYNLQYT